MEKDYHVVFKDAGADVSWDDIHKADIGNYLWEDNGYCPEANARVYYTSDSIHVMLGAYEKEIKAVYERMNDPVYKDSCLEFFIQPDPGRDCRYLNFEFNSKGVLLLGLGCDRNGRAIIDGSEFKLFGIKTFVKPLAGIKEWGVEFKIPFEFLARLFPTFDAAFPGSMKGNFYKCGDDTDYPHFGCWSRIGSDNPDFHQSCYFGTLIFECMGSQTAK